MATKIHINIGPLSAPGRILSAVRDVVEVELKTVCAGTADKAHEPAKVNGLYRCSSCGREHSSYHPFPRGIENPDGTWTIPPAEDVEVKLDDTVTKTLTFLPTDRETFERTAVPNGKFYYVAPDAKAAKFYPLVRDVMKASMDTKAWVTTWAYRSAVNPVRATIMGDLIAIQQYAWPAAVVDRPAITVPEVDAAFLEMALQMVDGLAVEWDLATFTDTKAAKLAELAQIKPSPDSAAVTGVDAASGLMAEMQAFIAANAKPTTTRKVAAKPAARKRTVRKPTATKENA